MAPHLVSSTGGRSSGGPRRDLPYILIADADERRVEACIEAIKPHRHGALVVTNMDEAVGILDRFGPPLLFLTDILLPPQGAFGLIETVRNVETTKTGIVAWAATRALREFAICRLASQHVRVIRGSAPAPVIRSLVDTLLSGAPAPRVDADAASGIEAALPLVTDDMVDWLQAKARELCNTPGIAVYMRDGAGNSFRSSGSWTPDEPIPQSLDYLPHALNRVIETHVPFVALDVNTDAAGHTTEERGFGGLRGIVAVPVFGSDDRTVVGMISAFDVKPLSLDARQIEALAELGRTGVAVPPVQSTPSRFVARRNQSAPRASSGGFPRQVVPKIALLDRDSGSAAVARELARVRREQYPLSVVLFDVDAGTRDHASTDQSPNAIETLGSTLTRVVRGSDLAIRWSQQELLLVLPGIGSSQARRVADRVRQAVRSDGADRMAIVEGVAELGADSWESMVTRAGSEIRGSYQPPLSGAE